MQDLGNLLVAGASHGDCHHELRDALIRSLKSVKGTLKGQMFRLRMALAAKSARPLPRIRKIPNFNN